MAIFCQQNCTYQAWVVRRMLDSGGSIMRCHQAGSSRHRTGNGAVISRRRESRRSRLRRVDIKSREFGLHSAWYEAPVPGGIGKNALGSVDARRIHGAVYCGENGGRSAWRLHEVGVLVGLRSSQANVLRNEHHKHWFCVAQCELRLNLKTVLKRSKIYKTWNSCWPF